MKCSLKQFGILGTLLLFIPVSAFAQAAGADSTATTQSSASASTNFSREGVFGCSRNTAQLPASVGAFSAIGGVYVPVADYATELNTGVLVYQQCVLRGIVDRMSESALTAQTRRVLQTFQTGRDGGAQYPQDLPADQLAQADKDNLYFFQNRLTGISDTFKSSVTNALLQTYKSETRGVTDAYTCPYKGDMNKVWTGEDQSPEARKAWLDTRCDPVFAYLYTKDAQDSYAAGKQDEMLTRLGWSGGTYDVGTVDPKTNDLIVNTPGFLVKDTVSQVVTSGYRKTENASDVDQMVGALYAGLSTQVISSATGLAGLFQKIGTQASYLDQVSAESSAGLRDSIANAALQQLGGAKTAETAYYTVVNGIATTLTKTINQLRNAESQCYGLIIDKVCGGNAPANGTCTNASTTVYKIPSPTPTNFSQPIINAQISPIATAVVANIQKSQKALTLINALIAGVTNTSSLDAQRLAVVQLDQLISSRALHVQSDVTAVQGQQGAITTSMQNLVNDTVKAWADGTDPNVAWCNVNNPATITLWQSRWRK